MKSHIKILTIGVAFVTIGSVYLINADEKPQETEIVKKKPATEKVSDWRTSGTPEEQLETLVKITPGTSHWMMEVAYRYQSTYWAAKQEKWEFADYQVASMEKTINRVALARTKRAKSAKEFSASVFARLKEATKSRDWETFDKAFTHTAAQCMVCHAKEGYPYIVVPSIPSKPNSIVLGYPEDK